MVLDTDTLSSPMHCNKTHDLDKIMLTFEAIELGNAVQLPKSL